MNMLFVIIGLITQPWWLSKITTNLNEQLLNAKSDQMISCIIIMQESYPYAELENYSVREKIVVYQKIAHQSQKDLIDWLRKIPDGARIGNQYWVFNGFYIEAKPEVIEKIAQRSDVKWISHNGEVHIIAEPGFEPAISTRAIEWNIQKVMADSCWNAGFTGQGIIIGMCDTGVDYEHPALAGKWTGYWLDVINGQPLPYDDMTGTWHGTHCMGTILGGDGFGSFTEDIGVAPDAQYVAAKMLNSSGSGTYDQCAQGLQFMADLKDSVDIKAVSNSWAGSNAADTFFYPVMRTYISIAIVPVFANANNGPAPGTVGCPGSYSNNIGVGATDSNDDIANLSSRGPAPDQPPFNDPSTWLRDDWNLIKPQISAPGVNINSAKGDGSGGYHTLNGTSMATPHVAGAVAILCQKNPTLTPEMLYNILLDNVDEPSQGSPYPNNDYGWGRLNIWQALNGTPTMNQPWVAVIDKTIDDINPGETGQMTVTVKNLGGADAYNTTGTLESFDNYISISNGTYVFGDLAPDDTASNNSSPFLFTAHSSTPEGYLAKLGFIIHADGDSADFNDTVYYTIQIGTPPPPYVIYEDDFEYGSGLDSFTVYWEPTGNWHRTTVESHSPTHSAYSGTVSDNAYTLTLRNAVDLSSFPRPKLSVWYMYDFESGIFMDEASIQMSTDGGSSWSTIWEYDWLSGDAQPWTEDNFSLTPSNNVKIRFLIDGYEFFQDYTDWYIDDFKIYTPTDNEPPYFTNTTIWPDTNLTGPFPVYSMITDASGIDSAYLNYRVNSGSWQQLVMNPQGDDMYAATIPQQNMDDTIDYYLWARDLWIEPNTGADPVGAPGEAYYSFTIGIIGVLEDDLSLISFLPLMSNPTKGKVKVKFTVPKKMNVSLVVYDVAGRKVRQLIQGQVQGGEHQVVWNRKDDQRREIAAGIYFLSFSVDESAGFNKIEKFILLK